MGTTADTPLTERLRAAAEQGLTEGIAQREDMRARLDEADEDARMLIARLPRIDAVRSTFHVRICDTSVSVYSLGSEEADETYSAIGLEQAIASAERCFASRHGAIRTDGFVRYEVSVEVAGSRLPVDLALWQRFTSQSLASLRKGQKAY